MKLQPDLVWLPVWVSYSSFHRLFFLSRRMKYICNVRASSVYNIAFCACCFHFHSPISHTRTHAFHIKTVAKAFTYPVSSCLPTVHTANFFFSIFVPQVVPLLKQTGKGTVKIMKAILPPFLRVCIITSKFSCIHTAGRLWLASSCFLCTLQRLSLSG